MQFVIILIYFFEFPFGFRPCLHAFSPSSLPVHAFFLKPLYLFPLPPLTSGEYVLGLLLSSPAACHPVRLLFAVKASYLVDFTQSQVLFPLSYLDQHLMWPNRLTVNPSFAYLDPSANSITVLTRFVSTRVLSGIVLNVLCIQIFYLRTHSFTRHYYVRISSSNESNKVRSLATIRF